MATPKRKDGDYRVIGRRHRWWYQGAWRSLDELLALPDVAKLGMTRQLLYARLVDLRWPFERALSEPVGSGRKQRGPIPVRLDRVEEELARLTDRVKLLEDQRKGG